MTPASNAGDSGTTTHWTRIFHVDLFNRARGDDAPPPARGTPAAFTPVRSRRDAYPGRRSERMTLFAADGYPLAATRYAAAGTTRGHVVVAGAIGVPQRYYRRFAEFAALSGYSTLTFDYRGVALSAPSTLKGFRMNYFDWGRQDLAAAVDAMSASRVPLYAVGHAFGGHAFGVLPNHDKLTALCTFGIGAGWHGWMPPLERLRALATWHVLGPLLTRWKGYLPWSLLGMGEDIPLDVYQQWKRWCRYPSFFFDDPSMRYIIRSFDRVRTPLMAANAIDDRRSPPKSRDAFMAGYRNAAQERLDIEPARVGMRAIGHMGYFKADAVALWEFALAWLESRGMLPREYAPNVRQRVPA